ncbi:sensor histidine kinase [Aporhodopirellula aestuarii]|uniref:histidine kinase n=1 Tax=Aporhodopirellula aestuarii TaxID=2950107 RepID=A0ABT0TXI6_9BACT|nr:HAMP domain-containing sensor histidine kinase [Aporhodopirellula aestuarii]MCM2369314.1 HAMP domain-containing histidine kinase [Aporhodopirellula aestuarii]
MSQRPQTPSVASPSAPPKIRPRRVAPRDDSLAEPTATNALLLSEGGAVHRVDSSRGTHSSRGAARDANEDRGDAPVEMAVRLISETAHDLRSPLASVAATMELIRDGQLGQVTSMQSDVLQAALKQCDYLNALVGEMLHADGLIGGTTTLHRRVVRRSDIRTMVSDATAAVLATKRIELLFDGMEGDAAAIFVDPMLLCRLLVNLVVNAERASGEDTTILIKAHDENELGVVRWSVVDCGGGMSGERLRQLADRDAVSKRSSRDFHDRGAGTGLGLMICRQLATLHYSDLKIRSRVGSGTDVMFETPLAHPTAVATAYARFRNQLFGPTMRPTATTPSSFDSDSSGRADASSSWEEVSLGFVGSGPRRDSRVAIGATTITGEKSAAVIDTFDRLLQSRLGRFEMSYRTTRRTWVWVLDADHRSAAERLRQMERSVGKQLENVEIVWSEPTIVPVGHRSLQSLLIDRMTTQALSAATSEIFGGSVDRDTVRPGTNPIVATPVAATRLDQELRRLTVRMKQNSERLKSQSASIRPPVR